MTFKLLSEVWVVHWRDGLWMLPSVTISQVSCQLKISHPVSYCSWWHSNQSCSMLTGRVFTPNLAPNLLKMNGIRTIVNSNKPDIKYQSDYKSVRTVRWIKANHQHNIIICTSKIISMLSVLEITLKMYSIYNTNKICLSLTKKLSSSSIHTKLKLSSI